jgi:hypothetical protein
LCVGNFGSDRERGSAGGQLQELTTLKLHDASWTKTPRRTRTQNRENNPMQSSPGVNACPAEPRRPRQLHR